MKSSPERSRENLEINPKQARWQELAQQVDRIIDKLGLPIDNGIKESIIALHALGFHTTGSCEGHEDHVIGAPYIDIESKEQELIDKRLAELKKKAEGQPKEIMEQLKQESRTLTQELERGNLEERMKLIPYLDEFYRGRNTPYDVRITIESLARGWSRLQNQGTALQKIRSGEEKKAKLREYQEEMRAFTDFLKNKYFTE